MWVTKSTVWTPSPCRESWSGPWIHMCLYNLSRLSFCRRSYLVVHRGLTSRDSACCIRMAALHMYVSRHQKTPSEYLFADISFNHWLRVAVGTHVHVAHCEEAELSDLSENFDSSEWVGPSACTHLGSDCWKSALVFIYIKRISNRDPECYFLRDRSAIIPKSQPLKIGSQWFLHTRQHSA